MVKNIIVEYMKGHYNNSEIEEMTLFIDSLLPKEAKEDLLFKQQENYAETFDKLEKAKPLRSYDNCSECDFERILLDGLCKDCWCYAKENLEVSE